MESTRSNETNKLSFQKNVDLIRVHTKPVI